MDNIIADPAAAVALSNDFLKTGLRLATDWVLPGALRVLAALAIFVIGAIVSGRVARFIEYATQRVKIDATLGGVLGSLGRYAVLLFTLLAVLNKFGVDTAAFIAVLGAAGFAIGLSLQGTLSNVAAGALLLFLRPFKVGDSIKTGAIEGVVQRIDLFSTELLSADGVYILAPNGTVWGSVINNFTRTPTRAVAVKIAIDASADAEKALSILEKVVKEESRLINNSGAAAIDRVGWNFVDLALTGTVNNADYVGVTGTLRHKAFFALREANIPFPAAIDEANKPK